ncbi:universal stress protein [Nonomuraea soli]|uniref:Nucleotide-binding universal stress UspA family protein n=1 Tax=Nonomuraea soli TaxID=1032476 RepID=A0A7W0CFE9_9ACTN|nr:universal stress protein [Nonomuraea soli]MBA2890027.1 nucleotide-binding universal stress UspA family protein [Nonomuraea soli]
MGYDGSAAAERAAQWAVAEAIGRRLPLTLCRGWKWPYPKWPGERIPEDLAARMPQRVLDGLAGRLRRSHPLLDVGTILERASSAALLASLSEHADLLVVGARRGSLGARVATGAPCPVVVVRGESSGPVVLGFGASYEAMRLAAEEAVLRQVPLKVLVAGADDLTRSQRSGWAWSELQHWRHHYAQLQADVETVGRAPKAALLEASWQAGLIVVGSSGPISRTLVRHAACPVAIVGRVRTEVLPDQDQRPWAGRPAAGVMEPTHQRRRAS